MKSESILGFDPSKIRKFSDKTPSKIWKISESFLEIYSTISEIWTYKNDKKGERGAAAEDSSAPQTHLLPFENAKCCEETYKKIAELVGGSAL